MDEQTTKKSLNPILWVLILIVLLGGGYLLFKSQTQQTQVEVSPTPTLEEQVATDEGETMAKEESSTFEVEGSNFKFNLEEIRVKKGTRVLIIFKNTGGLHDFVIDEFGVKTERLSDGGTEIVQFTADKSGTFEYYCSVGNHRQQGMVGSLIVEE